MRGTSGQVERTRGKQKSETLRRRLSPSCEHVRRLMLPDTYLPDCLLAVQTTAVPLSLPLSQANISYRTLKATRYFSRPDWWTPARQLKNENNARGSRYRARKIIISPGAAGYLREEKQRAHDDYPRALRGLAAQRSVAIIDNRVIYHGSLP